MLTTWSRKGPMASKERSRTRIQTPSGPHAPERFMESPPQIGWRIHLPRLGQSHPSDTKTTRTDPRQAAGDGWRHPRASQASRDTRADIDKIGIHLVRRSREEGGGVATLASDQRADSAVERAATLSPQSRLYIRPTVTPNRRPDPPVKFTEGRRSPHTAHHALPLCHQTQGRRGDSWRPEVSDTRGPERGMPVENSMSNVNGQ